MRRFLSILLTMIVPSLALAQSYNNSPMLVITPAEPAPVASPAQPNATVAATATPAPTTPVANASAVLPVVPPLPANFPEWAVTNAAQNTAGNTNPTPATPSSPITPAAPIAVSPNQTPATPVAPASPESPISKLWPRDTVPIFVKACVGFHVELIPACTCTITELMTSMPHDEFLKLSETNAIESDPRLQRARLNCVAAPARKD